MGWTYAEKTKGQSIQDFFTAELSGLEILASHSTVHAAYMAVKNTTTGAVYALVILLKYIPKSKLNFAYKYIDESMGPFYYDCPPSILDLLDEPANTDAAEWRAKCREAAKDKQALPKLEIGMYIKPEVMLYIAKQPIKYMRIDSIKGQRITAYAWLNTWSATVHLSKAKLGKFSLVEPPTEAV